MQYVLACGIIKGQTESRLAPKAHAIRAETAEVLRRFLTVD